MSRIKSSPATARKRRQDAAVVKILSALVRERDGNCCARHMGYCDGPLELAHWGDFRRFKTRRMKPEDRHETRGALLLCKRHHAQYDGHKLSITADSLDGCDGALVFTMKDKK